VIRGTPREPRVLVKKEKKSPRKYHQKSTITGFLNGLLKTGDCGDHKGRAGPEKKKRSQKSVIMYRNLHGMLARGNLVARTSGRGGEKKNKKASGGGGESVSFEGCPAHGLKPWGDRDRFQDQQEGQMPTQATHQKWVKKGKKIWLEYNWQLAGPAEKREGEKVGGMRPKKEKGKTTEKG